MERSIAFFQFLNASPEERPAFFGKVSNLVGNPRNIDIGNQVEIVPTTFRFLNDPVFATSEQPIAPDGRCQQVGIAEKKSIGIRRKSIFGRHLPASDGRDIDRADLTTLELQVCSRVFLNGHSLEVRCKIESQR